MEYCKISKYIHDCVHEYIPVTHLALMVIDDPLFQRMRNILQLSTCRYVYPNATHSRFEHSIGTYHLTGRLLKALEPTISQTEIDRCFSAVDDLAEYFQTDYNGRYTMDRYIQELIKIAALAHDLGHGPFSHTFDDFIVAQSIYKKHPMATHEARSCTLIEQIIKGNSQLSKIISDRQIDFIKSIILGSGSGFIYQIVCNKLNGIDIDKYDYIARDSYMLNIRSAFDFSRLVDHIIVRDGHVCYPIQAVNDIINLFQTRYKLHKTVYTHKVAIATQLMLKEALNHVEDIFNIAESITDMKKFVRLTDEYVINLIRVVYDTQLNRLPSHEKDKITQAKLLLDAIESRKIYALAVNIVTAHPIDTEKLVIPGIDTNDIVICQSKIGYVGGDSTYPFDNIHVYKTKNAFETISSILKLQEITCLLPSLYREYITMVFCRTKDKTKQRLIAQHFEPIDEHSTNKN